MKKGIYILSLVSKQQLPSQVWSLINWTILIAFREGLCGQISFLSFIHPSYFVSYIGLHHLTMPTYTLMLNKFPFLIGSSHIWLNLDFFEELLHPRESEIFGLNVNTQ